MTTEYKVGTTVTTGDLIKAVAEASKSEEDSFSQREVRIVLSVHPHMRGAYTRKIVYFTVFLLTECRLSLSLFFGEHHTVRYEIPVLYPHYIGATRLRSDYGEPFPKVVHGPLHSFFLQTRHALPQGASGSILREAFLAHYPLRSLSHDYTFLRIILASINNPIFIP